MSDDADHLRTTIDQLRRQLETSRDVPPETRAALAETVRDIERMLRGEPHHDTSLTGRLAEAVSEFEGQHPTLSGSVGSVIDALSRMGI